MRNAILAVCVLLLGCGMSDKDRIRAKYGDPCDEGQDHFRYCIPSNPLTPYADTHCGFAYEGKGGRCTACWANVVMTFDSNDNLVSERCNWYTDHK